MTDVRSILFDLQRRYALDWEGQAPTRDDLVAWSGGSDNDLCDLFNQIAGQLALGYHDARFSFAFCDEVVNHLWGMMITRQVGNHPPPWPELFYRVYEAFDAGESSNPLLPPHDPVKTYTDPAIAEIVREL